MRSADTYRAARRNEHVRSWRMIMDAAGAPPTLPRLLVAPRAPKPLPDLLVNLMKRAGMTVPMEYA
jgi:hypothetical protein